MLALAACGGGDDEPERATTEAAATTTEAATTTDQPLAGVCETVEAPEPKPDGGQEAPTGGARRDARPTRSWSRRTAARSRSSSTRRRRRRPPLRSSRSPRAASSTTRSSTASCPGFVIQGGDPTGTGTGGPGYKTVDVPPPDAAYTEGVVAMAKAGAEAPGTSGSQFFVVTGADVGLPPEYAVVGKVTEGSTRSVAIDNARRRRRAAVAAGRDRAGHGSKRPVIGAVVLAAGAATRFGAPKQRLLLPAVLERLTGVDQVVVVAGAYPLENAVHCPDWERGPGASLRCGLAALDAAVEAAVVVLADGPELATAAIERVLAAWRESGAPTRGGELRRRARPSARRRPLGLGRHPGRGPAGARAAARPVRRPGRAGRRRRPGRSTREVQEDVPTNRCRHRCSSSRRSRTTRTPRTTGARWRPRGCTGS